ncbi:hypothetical protein [Croceibacterium salegens]|nr:hypothetical protein [Croceibacterium salegens]
MLIATYISGVHNWIIPGDMTWYAKEAERANYVRLSANGESGCLQE